MVIVGQSVARSPLLDWKKGQFNLHALLKMGRAAAVCGASTALLTTSLRAVGLF
jgi:hypothetical protein